MRGIAVQGRKELMGCIALVAVGSVFAIFSTPAWADTVFPGGQGSGADQTQSPSSVAVDRETGAVYVADTGNNRIDVFEANGTFVRAFGWGVLDGSSELQVCTTVTGCMKGLPGTGEGQFEDVRALAVDNDPASLAHHDVYAFDGTNRNVQRFHPTGEFVLGFGKLGTGPGQFDREDNPIALGPGGVVYVGGQDGSGQSRVQEFEPTGSFIKQILLEHDECDEGKASKLVPLNERITGLAVDSAANFYIDTHADGGGIREYDAAGNPLHACALIHASFNIKSIAVDGADNLFVADNTESQTATYEYDPSGKPLRTLYGNGTIREPAISLAPYAGDLILVEASSPRRIVRISPEPPGPVVVPFRTKATPVGNLRATLRAQVNPEGKASTVRFEYVDDAEFQANGFSNAKVTAPVPIVTDEVQQLQVSATGGQYKLTFGADTTSDLSFNATTEEIQKALGKLPSIGSSNVAVSGASPTYLVTFTGALSDKDVPQLKVSNGTTPLSGGGVSVTTVNPSGLFIAHEARFEVPCPEPEVELAAKIEAGECLVPSTVYHLRAAATNADSEPESRHGGEATFETLQPIELGEEWATQVGPDAARLHTELNPNGVPASAHFEYVEAASFDVSGFAEAKETASVDFGAGAVKTSRSLPVSGLEPDTSYRYRYVAENFFGKFIGPVPGPPRSFTTSSLPPEAGEEQCPNAALRSGASAALPDCRAYEMVSPVEKNGGDIVALEEITKKFGIENTLAQIVQATPEGKGIAYSAGTAFGDAQSAPFSNQYIARRDPEEGWLTHSVNTPREGLSLYGTPTELLFSGFSEDLCSTWFRQDTDLALAPGAPPGVPNLYRRRNCGEGSPYELITNEVPPGFGKVSEGTNSAYIPTMQGFSTDGATTAFKAPAKLTGDASSKDGIYQAYLYREGALRLLSILPGGEAAETHASVGTALGFAGKRAFDSVYRAVSTDGERAFFSVGSEESAKGVHEEPASASAAPSKSRPYLRVNAMQEQSALAQVSGTGKLEKDKTEVKSLIVAKGKGNFVSGSATVSGVSMEVGQFVAGQPVIAAGKVAGGTTILAVKEEEGGKFELTLSAAATASGTASAISSDGPAPFAVGQAISGPGIAAGTTIVTIAKGSVTLSRAPSENKVNAPLIATVGCTEAEKACTLQLSEEPGFFYAANPDATQALYGETYSEGGGTYQRLCEFDVGKALAHEAGARSEIAPKALGILGASTDLSHVYLVSEAVCSGEEENSEGEKALAGKPNLYLYERGESCGAGEMTFVAGLLASEVNGDGLDFAKVPVNRSARVSGDGLHATFLSRARLTGYDNTDANSGQPDQEVFLYDAEGKKLSCVSCNTSGGRPEGREVIQTGSVPIWAAGTIPGWETEFQPSRPLSEDGSRLFFDSFDALVARDTNGREDVYEWEQAADKKECLEGIGGELFAAASGGCLSLISSGKGAGDAEFLDADKSGENVFFTTPSSLVPKDPGLVDIYDARVGGGEPQPAPPEAECEGEACQNPPGPPEDSTPGSSSLEGGGNLATPPTSSRCPKGKRKVNRGGKARCAPTHRKHKRHPSRRTGR